MLRVAVLVSGGGTNLQALIDAEKSGSLSDAAIVRVISNHAHAYALSRARDAGIETCVVSRKEYAEPAAFDEALQRAVDEARPDLVVLAGFLVRIPEAMVAAYRMRIINVHPSLIPAFCGDGFYGLKVHEAALARGVKVSGATVHYVDEGMDTGPILLQKAVEVYPGDTAESLQKRVMEEAEWQILPQAVRMIAQEKAKGEQT